MPLTFKGTFIASITLLLFSACSVNIPMHESESPEVLGPWGFRIGEFAGSTPMFVTSSAAPSTDKAGFTSALGGYRVDIGITDHLQINGDFMSNGLSTGWSGALKFQVTGANYFAANTGNIASSITLRTWSSTAIAFKLSDVSDAPLFYDGDINATGYDLSFSIGNRWYDSFGGYIAGKAISGNIEAKYRSSQNGPIVGTETRTVAGGGAILGLYWSPHGDHFGIDFNLEGQFMNLPATVTADRVWYNTVMISVALPFRF